jgi:hypothetical protein
MTVLKYRRLSLEELEILKDDFITFLVTHGIDSEEWQRLKEQDPEKAEGWICVFSNFVLDKALTKITFIEHFDGNSLMCFKCEDERILLSVLESGQSFNTWQNMKAHVSTHPHLFQIYHSEKAYSISRNQEIYNLLQAGGLVSGPENYESIRNSLKG